MSDISSFDVPTPITQRTKKFNKLKDYQMKQLIISSFKANKFDGFW